MKRLRNHYIGVEEGDNVLFSDFQDGGDMWTGTGPRERRRRVTFSESFRTIPVVQCALSMWDIDSATNQRVDLSAEAIDVGGFDIVFRTWGDTRVARARVRWMAFGELRHADEWDLY
ncbi:H-type lectin domain-containing protein [Pseudooceanicola aestuarii]|uniref:H-type lectin domain-containing protein n=1 Tax=Pseudooceanicola aestuarii TaxID=2697319 RepID=UPI0013D04CA8|nr:H-type lectin domain-containing protein [Pseudooceanicola aestuarii]